MGITRKLENICQSLTLLGEQRNIAEFLSKTENAQRINGLVGDIYEAFLVYQVYT